MKILDVLERVAALYPHAITTEEMVDFCNELGSFLCTNYIESFETVFLKDGEMLPEGVSRENIIKVIKDGKELLRDDFGLGAVYYPDSRKIYFDSSAGSGVFKVIFRVPYYPVRYVKFEDTLKKTDNGYEFLEEHDIRAGDILMSGDKTFKVEAVTDGKEIIGSGNFDGSETDFERMIDDLTVTEAPYDNLYIEFLLAKVQRFSKDYEAENRSLANYNQMLEDFSKYLIKNAKTAKATQFINYW